MFLVLEELGMDSQFAFASRDDLWQLQNEMKSVYATQSEHSDRLARLERRQEEDTRMKSVWGTSSPFPSILGGTPQQGRHLFTIRHIWTGLLINSQTQDTTPLQRLSRILIKIRVITYSVVFTWTRKMSRGVERQEQTVCDSTKVLFMGTSVMAPVLRVISFL